MDHHHGNSHLLGAFLLNLSFTLIEFIGGIYTNSVAILSDAVHDLGDSLALLFAILMERVSKKKSDQELTFGYKRFSILGAFVNALILIGGSLFVLYTAVGRIFSVEQVHVPGMIVMSMVGIFFNSIAVFRLRKEEGMNARVVFMHLLEDVLGWISIFIVSILMLFFDLPILDPILSIAIAVFILSRIVPSLMQAGRIFLQYKPDDQEVRLLKQELEEFDSVLDVHDIHLWSLDGIHHVFSSHVLMDDALSAEEMVQLLSDLKLHLKERGISHATLEPELHREQCDPCEL